MGTLYSKPPEGSHTGGSFYYVFMEVGLLEPRFWVASHESAAAISSLAACTHMDLSLAVNGISSLHKCGAQVTAGGCCVNCLPYCRGLLAN